jgi:hypothetical protein
MARTLSDGFKASLNAAQTGEAYIVLVTIDHPNLSAPLRVNDSGATVVSNGDTYDPLPFAIILPDDTERQSAKAKLTIDNTDRRIIQTLRQMNGPASCVFTIVMASAPDTVEAQWDDFTIADFVADVNTVECILSMEDFSGEPYPAETFNVADFPGLY